MTMQELIIRLEKLEAEVEKLKKKKIKD